VEKNINISALREAIVLQRRSLDILEGLLFEYRDSLQVAPLEEQDDEVLTVKDVMERYQVSKAWVHKHLDELPAHRGGPEGAQRRPIRFFRREVDEWWSRNK